MDKNLLKITTILCSIGVFVGGGKALASTFETNTYTGPNGGTLETTVQYDANGNPITVDATRYNSEGDLISHKDAQKGDGMTTMGSSFKENPNTGTQVSKGFSTNEEDYLSAYKSVYGEKRSTHKNVTVQDGEVTGTRTIENYDKGSVTVEKSSDGSTTVTARDKPESDESTKEVSVTKSADGTVTATGPNHNSKEVTKRPRPVKNQKKKAS